MRARNIYILLLLILLTSSLAAQPYEHAGGVRAGYSSGITYKGFLLFEMAAIQADLLYNRHGFQLAGAYVYHVEPFRSERWLLHFGGGAFAGTWEAETSAGLLVSGGIEYVIRDLPLNLGLDWRPMMNIFRVYEVDLLDIGLTIRYRFAL